MIIFIHGFNSAPNRFRTKFLNQFNVPIYQPFVDYANIEDEFIKLKRYVKENIDNEELVIMGASLGGFVAIELAKRFQCKCMLFNPSVFPERLEKYNGMKMWNYVNESYLHDYPSNLSDILTNIQTTNHINFPLNVYVNEDDEFIDVPRTIYSFGDYVTTFPEGGHSFRNWDKVEDDIERMLNFI